MIQASAPSVSEVSQLAGALVRPAFRALAPPVPPEPQAAIPDRAEDVVSEEQNQNADLEALTEAVEKTQATVNMVSKRLAFNVDKSGHLLQVQVIDRETEEVLREIPPDEFLRLAEKIKETLGLVIDTVA